MTAPENHDGDLNVNGDRSILGAVGGDLVVLNGLVIMTGTVVGTIRARGGVTVLNGAAGNVSLEGGTVRVTVNSMVNGKMLSQVGKWEHPVDGGEYPVDTSSVGFDYADTVTVPRREK